MSSPTPVSIGSASELGGNLLEMLDLDSDNDAVKLVAATEPES